LSKINVFDETGRYAFSTIAAETIYQEINKLLLMTDDLIELDFEQVEVVVCKFWSYAIGQLLRCWDSETLNQRIKIINISSYQETTLRLVLDSAKKFYQKC
jgi:DNA polymerase III delta subunit